MVRSGFNDGSGIKPGKLDFKRQSFPEDALCTVGNDCLLKSSLPGLIPDPSLNPDLTIYHLG